MSEPSAIVPERVAYGTDPSQFVDVYEPEHPRSGGGVVVSIHGGYWRARWGLDLNDPICRHLARAGWSVVNIEYRRIVDDDRPSIWDEMADDVLSAASVAVSADAVDIGPVIAVGHSAGGHLALWLAANGPDRGIDLDGVVALAPVADLAESDRLGSSDHAARALLGGAAEQMADRYRAASPVALLPLGVRQLVVHGDADDSVPLAMSVDYVERARTAGDTVDLLTPNRVDHFHLIDPDHDVWRPIDRWIDELPGPGSSPT